MKCISIFLFSAAAVCAADFTTGQAARLVIGQSTFTSQDSNSSDTILGAASGLAYAADTLFVADSNRVGASPTNHRVLLYQNLSGQLPRPTDPLNYNSKCPVCVGQATVVLGQPDFTTTTVNLAATPTTLRLPTAVASDGVHLVVADTDHNRVLIWNRIPTTNNAPADVVVGQPNFTTATVARQYPECQVHARPAGSVDSERPLYVADTQNNRVLIFNKIPTANGAAADVVLGQPNMTTFVEPDLTQQTNNATASLLLNPVSVTSDGVHLFVTDLGYNRVLIWNSIPTTNGAAADVVVGQPDMTSSIANNAFTISPTDTTVPPVETPVMCTVSNGVDVNNNPTYPTYCNSTVNFPRFALAAGQPPVHRRWRQRPRSGVQSDSHHQRRFGGPRDRPVPGYRQLHRHHQPGFRRRRFAAHPHVAGLGRHQPLRQRCLQPAHHRLFDGRQHRALRRRGQLRQH